MSSILALHVLAAKHGDGLRPELVEALKRQALMDRLPSISMSPGAPSLASDRLMNPLTVVREVRA